jgi:hypothetical protein
MVKAGSNAAFSVAATGPGPMSYQWWFNQTNRIQGATNSSLVLSNVNGTHEGTYYVSVSNPGGSVLSAGAHLKVYFDTSGQPEPLRLAASLAPEPGIVLLRFNVSSNITCTLQAAAQCDGPWTNLFNVAAAPSNRTITITNVISDRGFFRLTAP